MQGGVAHIYAVGRSATAVTLKVNGQFKIFLKVNGQAIRVKQNFSDKTRKSFIDSMLQ